MLLSFRLTFTCNMISLGFTNVFISSFSIRYRLRQIFFDSTDTARNLLVEYIDKYGNKRRLKCQQKKSVLGRNHRKLSLSASKWNGKFWWKLTNQTCFAVFREKRKTKFHYQKRVFILRKIVGWMLFFLLFQFIYFLFTGEERVTWEEKMKKDVFHSTDAYESWIVIDTSHRYTPISELDASSW